MAFWKTSTSQQPIDSSLRTPASRRMTPPSAQRLQTITEGGATASPPPIPRRSSLRGTASNSSMRPHSRRGSGSATSRDTSRTAPPPYNWVSESADSRDASTPGDIEKPGATTRESKGSRGGWLRLVLTAVLVLLVIIALTVGLGVGLTRRKHKHKNQEQAAPAETPPPQRFPLGQYSLVTALKSVETNCTSNPATWSCYPYHVFNSSDNSTSSSSLTTFNWVISNTSESYATNTSSPTFLQGAPANLSISTTNDPFGITFTDKSLTYISSSTNDTSARFTFSFTMPKLVIPSPAITVDNSAAECFFNQTVFEGTLYLAAKREYPSGDLAGSANLGGFQQWPYAVEISQTAAGGPNVPNCYKTVNGAVGAPITAGLVPQPDTQKCLCEYRNF